MGEAVILLHGLMMRRPALVPMALRLRKRDFAPELFAYSTLWRDPEEAIAHLGQRLRARMATSRCTCWRTAWAD